MELLQDEDHEDVQPACYVACNDNLFHFRISGIFNKALNSANDLQEMDVCHYYHENPIPEAPPKLKSWSFF
jgi:hypothetical protein